MFYKLKVIGNNTLIINDIDTILKPNIEIIENKEKIDASMDIKRLKEYINITETTSKNLLKSTTKNKNVKNCNEMFVVDNNNEINNETNNEIIQKENVIEEEKNEKLNKDLNQEKKIKNEKNLKDVKKDVKREDKSNVKKN